MDLFRRSASVLSSVVLSGALAIGALFGSPAAKATCVSAFGFGTGTGCASGTTSVAIGVGSGAQADSTSALFGVAFAFGTNAKATTGAGGVRFALFGGAFAFGTDAQASTGAGVFTLAAAVGDGAIVKPQIFGVFTLAAAAGDTAVVNQRSASVFTASVQLGPGASGVNAGVFALAIGAKGSAETSGVGNVALQLGPGKASSRGTFNTSIGVANGGTGNRTETTGAFNFAFNLSPDSKVSASGGVNNAINLSGSGNVVTASGKLPSFSRAFNILGDGNTVTAQGPLGIAGSILQVGATVTKTGPLFNINGFRLGPAATAGAGNARPAASAASAEPIAKKPADTRDRTR